jgi:hypothetical protein
MSINRLKATEQLFLLIFFSLAVTFYIIAKITNFREGEALMASPIPLISVEITGAVHKPRTIQVAQGSPLSIVLGKVKLKPFADRSALPLEQILTESCAIEVPALKEIQVEITGCVDQKISLTLPAGSRMCDLKGHLSLTSEADRSFLRRKRLLKPNEHIEIPARKMRKKRRGGEFPLSENRRPAILSVYR